MSEAVRDLLIDFVIALIELGEPLPVDLETRLMHEGIDVSFIKHKYGNI